MERVGLAWLAFGCVALGVLPSQVVAQLGHVPAQLGFAAATPPSSWWHFVPVTAREAAYAPLVFLLAIVAHDRHHPVGRERPVSPARAARSGLGLRLRAARLRACRTRAEGFGQPIRAIFAAFFDMKRELPSPFDRAPRYHVVVGDRLWRLLYAPLERIVHRVAAAVAWLQQGRIATYLLYSFATLLILLVFVL